MGFPSRQHITGSPSHGLEYSQMELAKSIKLEFSTTMTWSMGYWKMESSQWSGHSSTFIFLLYFYSASASITTPMVFFEYFIDTWHRSQCTTGTHHSCLKTKVDGSLTRAQTGLRNTPESCIRSLATGWVEEYIEIATRDEYRNTSFGMPPKYCFISETSVTIQKRPMDSSILITVNSVHVMVATPRLCSARLM